MDNYVYIFGYSGLIIRQDFPDLRDFCQFPEETEQS
jgi:hypothetical protein